VGAVVGWESGDRGRQSIQLRNMEEKGTHAQWAVAADIQVQQPGEKRCSRHRTAERAHQRCRQGVSPCAAWEAVNASAKEAGRGASRQRRGKSVGMGSHRGKGGREPVHRQEKMWREAGWGVDAMSREHELQAADSSRRRRRMREARHVSKEKKRREK
jgi:hypothetical protein